ncbi:conserved hypothetical protein [Syntrophobacter sp. SbD1]|nr:conserved hypothetical protein [Syntrophobacter sp. SbD1]
MNGTERDRVSDEGASSLGEILGDLSRNAAELIQGEVQMASAEMSRKVSRVWKDSQLVTVGACVAYAGFLAIIAAAIIGLSLIIPAGWAALAIGVAALLAGAITMRIGKKRLNNDFLPSETINTFREDTKWMRNQLM